MSKDIRDFLEAPGDFELGISELVNLRGSPFDLLMDYWEDRMTPEDAARLLREDVRQANEDWENSIRESIKACQAPDLKFREMEPPYGLTHCHGFWTDWKTKKPVWVSYLPPLTKDKLPDNAPYEIESHWVGRFLPDRSYIAERQGHGRVYDCERG